MLERLCPNECASIFQFEIRISHQLEDIVISAEVVSLLLQIITIEMFTFFCITRTKKGLWGTDNEID